MRVLLEPKPSPPTPLRKGLIGQLHDFFSQYKVLGMAVAFIIGLYLGALVQSLVTDILMPIIQYATPPGVTWEKVSLGPFLIGQFGAALLTFFIVVLVVFAIVKMAEKTNTNLK